MSMESEQKQSLNETVENKGVEPEAIEIDCAENTVGIIDVEADKIESMGWFIRDKSFEGQVCNAEEFLEEPFFLEVEELITSIEELKEREEFKDIYSKKGSNSLYLFSDKYVTQNYADMLVMVEEKDLLKMVADTVRKESKTYPRPTSSKLFTLRPFNLSKEQFDGVLEQLKKKEEYKDIQESKASNGVLYLYSDEYMTKAHANSLTEWLEVEQRQNP